MDYLTRKALRNARYAGQFMVGVKLGSRFFADILNSDTSVCGSFLGFVFHARGLVFYHNTVGRAVTMWRHCPKK